ncbi:DUF6496 domain-containing protein [Antarcticirhabdus aurantiaca]|uniref:DUF6496 domain-containing protein n=1 Tax=Antarcticirhabdus aurantiaca TaxID=2606717 RepID=A0ACD4NHI1_9HYPH|nr:DUF6496 domain-containing protein [Antarcticirhabdus aurantiaca]WAJ26310.1 DUF6496 domain-containing protein [Jeongeuplla avenae]
MAQQQTDAQKETVARVMHEFKHGELRVRGTGAKVTDRSQAVAIALREAGATNQEDPETNRETLRKTKSKEARGKTAQAEAEGKGAQKRTMDAATKRRTASDSQGRTKQALYAEARKRDIPGRSSMTKSELERALAK